MVGKVFLVGAGPGDPDLMTLKGKTCLENADVVIYDFLASPMLLGMANPEAELIYVGKKAGNHTLPQIEINQLLVEKAANGNTVVRLKGGDPFIFGRGGEEIEELVENKIPFEVVPGITSAIAVPAYAGIPLTHRQKSSLFTVVTGHETPTKKESTINWSTLAQNNGTLVFLMGIRNLSQITSKLIEHGLPSHTPVAVVRWGTTPSQQTVTGTLENIVQKVVHTKIKPPGIIIVGKVVELRDTINWFENLELFGKKIVVTRAREQASVLLKKLHALGAECIECPTIKIVPPASWQQFDQKIKQLAQYDWIIFTSVNGVKCFFNRLFENNLDVRALHQCKIAAIGPVTAKELLNYGLKCDVVPKTFRAESIIEAFSQFSMPAKNVLLPRAAQARPILPQELKKLGAQVDEIHVYDTYQDSIDDLSSVWKEGFAGVDMVTFTSSSTVTNFLKLFSNEQMSKAIKNIKIACIGPITAKTAEENGLEPHIIADEYTIDGLVEAIINYYAKT